MASSHRSKSCPKSSASLLCHHYIQIIFQRRIPSRLAYPKPIHSRRRSLLRRINSLTVQRCEGYANITAESSALNDPSDVVYKTAVSYAVANHSRDRLEPLAMLASPYAHYSSHGSFCECGYGAAVAGAWSHDLSHQSRKWKES